MQARIQSSLEAFSLFLVFSVQTKPTKTPLHLIVSSSEQNKKYFNAEIRWEYAFLSQIGLIILSFFFCHLNCLFQVEVFEAIQHILTSRTGWKIPKRVDILNTVIKLNSIASGNKILMLKVKSRLFLLKLEIHCMTGQKVKFT